MMITNEDNAESSPSVSVCEHEAGAEEKEVDEGGSEKEAMITSGRRTEDDDK